MCDDLILDWERRRESGAEKEKGGRNVVFMHGSGFDLKGEKMVTFLRWYSCFLGSREGEKVKLEPVRCGCMFFFFLY